MKSKNPVIFALLLRSAIVFSPILLSVGIASAQKTPFSPQPPVLSTPSQEELPRLTQEHRAFLQKSILLNVWLAILTLVPVTVIVALLLLRRVAIREIVDKAMERLHGLEELEKQLTTVKQEAQTLIQETRNTTSDLDKEVRALQQKITTEQESLSRLPSEISHFKKQLLAELETAIKHSTQEVQTLEDGFAFQVSELHLQAQQQRNITFENLRKVETELASQLSELQDGVQQQKDIALENLEQSRLEFANHLSGLHSDTEQQKNNIFEGLEQLRSEVASRLSELQIDVQQQKDIALENIEKSNSEYTSQISGFQSDAEQQKNKVLQSLEQLRLEFTSQLSQLQ
ncbi:MAG: hypothetical protein ACRDEA_15230, partial [Microcystaceae cyanobacterium]